MDQQQYGFRSIHLLQTQRLGTGAYGSVCKALCDDSLLCAAKIIHPILFDPNAQQQIESHREHRLPINRFMQECEFMNAMRHPNIVQYLGMYQDPQTRLPVLLMELMDDSLTHFLESSHDAIPYHIQVNFCHDITLAICYLHFNGIIHRDLSSNNVLLRGNVQAKVTDFGMAKLHEHEPNHQAPRSFLTMCPGADVYMPPEAVKDPPEYNQKIDCFSIGTLIIQILTRCFPAPGDRLHVLHTRIPHGTVYVPVPEIERRQNHISQVDPNHLLLPIALDCLRDNGDHRPSAQELCHRVAALKETPQFTESVRRAQEAPERGGTTVRRNEGPGTPETGHKTKKEEELQQQVQEKDDENHQLRQEHSQEIQGLQQIIGTQNNCLQEKDDIIREKEKAIEATQEEYQQLRETIQGDVIKREECEKVRKSMQGKIKSNQEVMVKLQKRIYELEQQVKEKTLTEVQARPQASLRADTSLKYMSKPAESKPMTNNHFALNWRAARNAPRKMYRKLNAVVNGDVVYFSVVGTRQILAYVSTYETWNKLPECPVDEYSFAVINNLPTIIGGKSSNGKVTNQLLSLTLTGEGENNWREVFQSMPTKRTSAVAVAVCTVRALIVIGGVGQDKSILKKVEIMDLDSQKWSSAADLPEITLANASATVCRDRIYLLGGYAEKNSPDSVYTCTLSSLFLSCRTRSFRELRLDYSSARSTVWETVANLPGVAKSTCVTLNGRLLAVGGCDSMFRPTSIVYMYDPKTNTWEVVSRMQVTRRLCFAAALPNNKLMVVGGRNTSSWSSETNSVEIATVVFS